MSSSTIRGGEGFAPGYRVYRDGSGWGVITPWKVRPNDYRWWGYASSEEVRLLGWEHYIEESLEQWLQGALCSEELAERRRLYETRPNLLSRPPWSRKGPCVGGVSFAHTSQIEGARGV